MSPSRTRPLLALTLTLLLVTVARAADLATEAQALLDEAAKAKKTVGMTAAIWKDGAVAWEGATGFADIENKVPATPDMIHRIASISKPITATAIMQLVEQNKIDLDQPIQSYVPAFPKKEQGEILVRHLLSHTSGIRHYRGDKESATTEYYPTTTAALAVFENDPIGFAPGQGFNYTTYGYTVLAAALEQASGEKLGAYLKTHVWDPAGMASTRLEVRGEIVPNRSRGYRLTPKGEAENAIYTDNSVRYAGGGMLSTSGDLVRFATAIQNGKLVQKETFATMLVPVELPDGKSSNYGFGWNVDTWDTIGRIAFHSGGQSGTSTHLLLCLDKGVAVAVISNTRGNTGLAEVCALMANLALGLDPPDFLKIEPEKSIAERLREENAQKAAQKK